MTKTTPKSSSPTAPAVILAGIPPTLRTELLTALNEIVLNYREGRWEPSMLNGGKLCEIVYSILRGYIDGKFPPRSSKPADMVGACRGFEKDPATLPRSVRIQIPRMLISLYEIRNNRSVGHVGGEVVPNHMDAVVVLYMAKWLVAELVRIFHNVDTATATAAVDALVEREMPVIWEVGGNRRVLATNLPYRDKSLLLLYSQAAAVPEAELFGWVEAPNASRYRRDVLRPAHTARLLEYDAITHTVTISPLGIQYVEDKLPLTLIGPSSA